MKENQISSTHTKAELESVLDAIAQEPDQSAVTASFSEAMETVTKHVPVRIPDRAPKGHISTYIMKHIHAYVGVAALALVVVVGYTLWSPGSTNYNDIYAALGEEPLQIPAAFEDDFGDITEESLEVTIPDTATAPTQTESDSVVTESPVSTPEPTTNDTNDVEETLAAIDALFAEDEDIDDSDLDDWFGDTSAGDGLTQSFDL